MSSEYWRVEFNRYNEAAIQAGASAGRMLMLINGGAAVALLALIGGLAEKGYTAEQLEAFGDLLVLFGWGVALAAGTVCLAYLINLFHAGAARARVVDPADAVRRWLKPAAFMSIAAIVTGALSLVSFIWGILAAPSALSALN